MFKPGLLSGQMPDITPAQVLAVLGWIGAQAISFGWIDQAREQRLVSLGATAVAVALKLADAYLRGQRAKAHATIEAAKLQAPSPPPVQ